MAMPILSLFLAYNGMFIHIVCVIKLLFIILFPPPALPEGVFQPTLFGGLGPALPEAKTPVHPQLSHYQLGVSSTLFGIPFSF